MLPQAPRLAASKRSKSIKGSATFMIQFHFDWERHMLIANPNEALDVLPRIETTAFSERGNLDQYEIGLPSKWMRK